MPTITDEALTERTDPYLAVDRALTAAERGAFMEHRGVGYVEGDQPADWISEADNTDALCPQIEAWWGLHGDQPVDYLRTLLELPEPLCRRLIVAALYAQLAVEPANLQGRQHRGTVEIATAAGLWARGYAEALGWSPTYEPIGDPA